MLGFCYRAVEPHLEEVVCGVALAVMASCIMAQVIFRYAFATAAPWAEELAVYGMVLAIYMGAALGVRERAHIRVMLFVNLLPKRLQVAVIVLADLVWVGFLGLLMWQLMVFMELAFKMTQISPGLGIDKKWAQLAVPIGIGLMILRMIQVYYRWLRAGEGDLPL